MKTSWTCPECGVAVPVALDASRGVVEGCQLKIRVSLPEDALADVFAHAWTHQEVPA